MIPPDGQDVEQRRNDVFILADTQNFLEVIRSERSDNVLKMSLRSRTYEEWLF